MNSHRFANNWNPTPGGRSDDDRTTSETFDDASAAGKTRIRMTAVDHGDVVNTSVEAHGPGADVLYLASELLLSLVRGAAEGSPAAELATLEGITAYCIHRIAADAGISVEDALQDGDDD